MFGNGGRASARAVFENGGRASARAAAVSLRRCRSPIPARQEPHPPFGTHALEGEPPASCFAALETPSLCHSHSTTDGVCHVIRDKPPGHGTRWDAKLDSSYAREIRPRRRRFRRLKTDLPRKACALCGRLQSGDIPDLTQPFSPYVRRGDVTRRQTTAHRRRSARRCWAPARRNRLRLRGRCP